MLKVLGRYTGLLILVLSAARCTHSTGPEENIALIYIENRTSVAVQHIFVADCATATWGSNRMAAGELFQPNTIRAVAVTPGCWNARVESVDGRSAERNAGNLARAGTFTWTLSSF
jgi:hypothetical protein